MVETRDFLAESLAGAAICNIGQVPKPVVRVLDSAVKRGLLRKTRMHWFQTLGPMKTVWYSPKHYLEQTASDGMRCLFDASGQAAYYGT